MSNKTFKDGYKPGEMILDEATGIIYDPRYGYPRVHVCCDCSVNNYCPGYDDVCMQQTYENNPDGHYNPKTMHRIDYDNLIQNQKDNIEYWENKISDLRKQIEDIKEKIHTANFTISQYQKKIDNNDPEYLAWKNFLETGTWKNYDE